MDRRSELELLLVESLPDIRCVQETKLNCSTLLYFENSFSEYHFASLTNDMHATASDMNLTTGFDNGGICLMWKKSLNSRIMRLKVSSKNYVGVILDTGVKTLFLSVYAPTRGKDTQFSDFLDELTELLESNEGKVGQDPLTGIM